MKNFLRAIRCAWPYRVRLGVSVCCAILAAAFWGLNFTYIYPVLKILGNEQTLQQWIDERIVDLGKDLEGFQGEADSLHRELKQLDEWPANKVRDQRERDLTLKLSKVEGRMEPTRKELYHFQVAKKYAERYLPHDRFETFSLLMLLIVVAVAVRGFFEFWQESLVGSVVNLSLFDLRNRFYREVIHLDVSHFSHEGTHELMSRFTNDMELLGAGLKTIFGRVVAEPLKALSCVVIACWISWQLTLMFLVLVPIALFILTKVGRVMKRATRRLLERMSSIYKILQESFSGIRVVKAFTMESYERRRFCTATKDYYYKAMQLVNLDALASPIVEVLGVAAVALALLAGAYLVLEKKTQIWGITFASQPLEAESLLSLYVMLAAIADPVRKLSSVYTRVQSGCAAADRIFSYIDLKPRVRLNADCPRLVRHEKSLEFRDVCFSYDPGRPILTNVRLSFKFGETIAFVGKNGCGKSTLLGLVPRFFDPDHGSILVDGVDIRQMHLRSLRQQIGIVTQDTILFDDTIYNNISYGNRRAPKEMVEEAARKAYVHELILKLPDGYETRVGEAGGKLSGGQKQRISLARAILRDPSVFILDEFTNQLDAESESLVHKALREFKKNRTTLVITHRLNTLEIADRIVVLDNGRVEAVGTHQELLRSCQTYQRLHEAQFQRLSA